MDNSVNRRRFTERMGSMRYIDVMRKQAAWRIAYVIGTECEVDGCGKRGLYGSVLVFDHCHEHGWVRGLVCTRHNAMLAHIDAVRKISGALVDFSGTSYSALLASCPDCKESKITGPATLRPICVLPGQSDLRTTQTSR